MIASVRPGAPYQAVVRAAVSRRDGRLADLGSGRRRDAGVRPWRSCLQLWRAADIMMGGPGMSTTSTQPVTAQATAVDQNNHGARAAGGGTPCRSRKSPCRAIRTVNQAHPTSPSALETACSSAHHGSPGRAGAASAGIPSDVPGRLAWVRSSQSRWLTAPTQAEKAVLYHRCRTRPSTP
jgi:hypothetical protein